MYMLKKSLLTLTALSLSLLPALAQNSENAEELTPEVYFETYGWIVGQQAGLAQLKLNDEELAVFIEALKASLSGEEAPHDPSKVGPKMSDYFRMRAEANANAEAAENLEEEKAFFAELDKNEDIKKTPSGLRYEIIEQGGDARPEATDKVKVHYEGKLINGEMFDSSLRRGEPIEFALNRVIAGWTEGLQLIGEGGKLKLYIPAELGYGSTARPGIPSGSTLIFDVELLEINPGKHVATTPPVGIEDIVQSEDSDTE